MLAGHDLIERLLGFNHFYGYIALADIAAGVAVAAPELGAKAPVWNRVGS